MGNLVFFFFSPSCHSILDIGTLGEDEIIECLVVKLTLKLLPRLPKKAVDWRMNYRERFGSRLDRRPLLQALIKHGSA